jgi:hypothetical protein
MDEAQETLRTSAFPSDRMVKVPWAFFTSLQHILHGCSNMFIRRSEYNRSVVTIFQEKWAKKLRINSVCYGRTKCWRQWAGWYSYSNCKESQVVFWFVAVNLCW